MKSSRSCLLLVPLLATWQAAASPSGFRETGTSPAGLLGNEGFAWDGTHNVVISQARIDRRADDPGWSLQASNRMPFAGLPGSPNHLGGGQAYRDLLYVPAETYHGCDPGQFADMSLAVYDTSTLLLVRYADLRPRDREASAVAIAPDRGRDGTIYVSSYCSNDVLGLYDLRTLSFEGDLALRSPIPFIQGMSYKDGTLFIAAAPPGTAYPDAVSHPDRTTIYAVAPDSGSVRPIYDSPVGGETEGMQWKGDALVLWINSDRSPADSRAHVLLPVGSSIERKP